MKGTPLQDSSLGNTIERVLDGAKIKEEVRGGFAGLTKMYGDIASDEARSRSYHITRYGQGDARYRRVRSTSNFLTNSSNVPFLIWCRLYESHLHADWVRSLALGSNRSLPRRTDETLMALPTNGLFDGLFPEGVQTAISGIENHVAELLPGERDYIATAAARRQHEFSTGRALARQLLISAGHPNFPILREADRIPIWPAELVGSISHTGGLCGVVVARRDVFLGLGLDVEPDAPADKDIERAVCRYAERDWVRAEGEAEQGRRCRIVFSVKEAVYKAFYPRTRTFWSFQDVGVTIDLVSGTFVAVLPESADRVTAAGRILRRDGWILSGVAVPA